MLTSFGLNVEDPQADDIFFQMPPIGFRVSPRGPFVPDYHVFLLSKRLIMDEQSFERLASRPHRRYRVVAETITTLYEAGHVRLVDYREILRSNESLLEKMLEHDMEHIDQWSEPLRAARTTWQDFAIWSGVLSDRDYRPYQRGPGSQSRSTRRSSQRLTPEQYQRLLFHAYMRVERTDQWRNAIRSYLSYVNSNLVISNELEIGFHDWEDFLPFYRQKFQYVGPEVSETRAQIDSTTKLFEIAFPEFQVRGTKRLLELLDDPRIADLRDTIRDAVEKGTEFDLEYANRVYREVLQAEMIAKRYRRIASYITPAISFVPFIGPIAQTIAELAVDQAAEEMIKRKLTDKYQWFYLLSDLV